MPSNARENYLISEVTAAPPKKLQLMLIEGAIRFIERTRQHWRANENDQACETLIRAEEIVSEILAGMNPEVDPGLVKKVAGIYLFIYRTLLEASASHDEQKLDEALRVLAIERETWREVCEKHTGSSAASNGGGDSHGRGAPAAPHLPDLGLGLPGADGTPTSGFSLEA